MRAEQEIKDEIKWARYELIKKDSDFSRDFLDGYRFALRWVLGKEEKLYKPK